MLTINAIAVRAEVEFSTGSRRNVLRLVDISRRADTISEANQVADELIARSDIAKVGIYNGVHHLRSIRGLSFEAAMEASGRV